MFYQALVEPSKALVSASLFLAQFRDTFGEDLAKFHAPLVERVDAAPQNRPG